MMTYIGIRVESTITSRAVSEWVVADLGNTLLLVQRCTRKLEELLCREAKLFCAAAADGAAVQSERPPQHRVSKLCRRAYWSWCSAEQQGGGPEARQSVQR